MHEPDRGGLPIDLYSNQQRSTDGCSQFLPTL